jgi:hypothetical protein
VTAPVWIITEQDVEQHRPALIAWAEANGLDPQRIALYPLTIEQIGDRKVIAYDEHQVNEHGRPLVDPARPTQVLTVHRSRTLRHALPEGIGRPLCTCTLGQHCPGCLGDQDHQR